MESDLKSSLFGYPIFNSFVDRLVQVKNAAAFFAPEMVMVLGVTIKVALVTGKVQFQDIARILQLSQISINRPQANIGYLFSHLLIDPISVGVR